MGLTGRAARRIRGLTIAALLAGACVPVTAAAQANAIANGEFSEGLTGWTTQVISPGSYFGYPHFRVINEAKCEPAQSGNRFLEIDVPGNAAGYVQQQIAVPASPGPLTFRTWGNLEAVQVTISAVTVADNAVHTLLSYSPPTLQATPSTCSSSKPVSESLDVSAYAGKTIDLRLQATASGHDGTIADFDDFALTAGAVSPPAPKCVVPKLKGLTLKAAKSKLKHAHCGVGAIKKRHSKSVRKGKVISSSPGKGASRAAGTKVGLTVSSG